MGELTPPTPSDRTTLRAVIGLGVTVACVGEEKNCNDNNVCTSDGCDSSLPDGCFQVG